MIENVLKATGTKNGAGIKRTIYFGLAADVDKWPGLAEDPETYADLMVHTTALEMMPGAQLFKFLATIRKSSLESLSAGDRGSKTAINRLQIVRAEISPAVVGFIEQHKNDDMVFLLEDLNGHTRILGTPELPAMFEEFNVPTGADVSDEKDVKITIESVGKMARLYPLEIPLTPIVIPEFLTYTIEGVDEEGILLSWTTNEGDFETGYEIQRSTDGATWATVHTTAANVESWSDTGLTTGNTYFYRVRAVNESVWSEVVSFELVQWAFSTGVWLDAGMNYDNELISE